MNTLFINACVREESRTLALARYLLERLPGEAAGLELQREQLEPLDSGLLAKRDRLLARGMTGDPMFSHARQFAQADTIVIAAPYWDLSFPALLKTYLETICVTGITFQYVDDVPQGLCKAKRLLYVTTSGGPMFADFGYPYVRALAAGFFGIGETVCFKAEGLDILGADVDGLLAQARGQIDGYLACV